MSDTQLVDQLKARIRDLELTLGQGDTNLAVTLRLTRSLSDLMGLLLALPVVTPDMIRQRLDIAADTKVAVHRLRAQLADRFGDNFIKSKRNVGYWIDPEGKAAIRAMLAGGPAPIAAETNEDVEDVEDDTTETQNTIAGDQQAAA